MAKPRKVQEPAAPYAATPKPSAQSTAPASKSDAEKTTAIRYADDATFRKAADKVFKNHTELFRKLAQ